MPLRIFMNQTSLKDRLLVATLPAEERENGRRLLLALAPIEAKLKRVEAELLARTRSPIPTISMIGDYLVEGGGKRIRPALLLLGASLLGYEGERDVRYAAVIEFIHTATLVHDDIIDDAELRRGRASVNRRWGNELTVLFGDYLYMKSMEIALDEGDLRVLRLLSKVTLEMTEGEIIGSERRGLVDLTLEGYLDIVRRKTALLFAAACRIPSLLVSEAAGEPAEAWGEKLWEYGLSLGIAFQLQDDLLDYTAKEEDLGKPVLSDLREGKLTLPLILSLPHASRAERKRIETVATEQSFGSVSPEEILAIVRRLGAVERAHEMVETYAGRARNIAASFPACPSRDGLLLAAEYAANRRK
jgi:octaprenyl-diphosphate synthase